MRAAANLAQPLSEQPASNGNTLEGSLFNANVTV